MIDSSASLCERLFPTTLTSLDSSGASLGILAHARQRIVSLSLCLVASSTSFLG
jgi:hypothetical protein